MSLETDLFIRNVRSFIGTPWVLAGRDLSIGVDCIGVVVLALKDLNFKVPDQTDYKSTAEFTRLIRFMLSIADKVSTSWKDAEPGDILVFGLDEIHNHVGVMDYGGKFIHSHAESAYKVCLEERLDGSWKMALHSVYRIRGFR